jgi:2'-5' RNA ligase
VLLRAGHDEKRVGGGLGPAGPVGCERAASCGRHSLKILRAEVRAGDPAGLGPAWSSPVRRVQRRASVVRTFVAVFPPIEISRKLGDGIREFRERVPDAKWVRPENFHFTLRFLGDLPEERLDLLMRCVAESVRGDAPFQLTLTGLGAFPSARKPRVLWVGTDAGGERLSLLARAVETRLRAERFGKADKRFSPHLTIARWRRPPWDDAVEKLIETAALEAGPFPVAAVRVMESKLRPQGPEYITRAECPLEG